MLEIRTQRSRGWRIAGQIRIARRVPEDEIVRVTLRDKDGAVLFKGEAR